MSAAVPYQIAWKWRDGTSVQFDDLDATTVKGAVRKLFKRLRQEYDFPAGDVVVLEVYRI